MTRRLTVLLNKPVGFVSGQPRHGHVSAVMLLQDVDRRGLAPCGRLDLDSRGLLVYSNDADVARRLTTPGGVDKEYRVAFEGKLSDYSLQLLQFGLVLDGKRLQRANVTRLDDKTLQVVLREGKKRQIRRMLEKVGCRVVDLERVRIGRVKLGALRDGEWRLLGPKEDF